MKYFIFCINFLEIQLLFLCLKIFFHDYYVHYGIARFHYHPMSVILCAIGIMCGKSSNMVIGKFDVWLYVIIATTQDCSK